MLLYLTDSKLKGLNQFNQIQIDIYFILYNKVNFIMSVKSFDMNIYFYVIVKLMSICEKLP